MESPISVPTSEENTKITLAEDYFFTSQATETISLTVNVKSSTGDVWYTQNDISLVCNAGEELKSESNYLTGKEAIKDPAKFTGKRRCVKNICGKPRSDSGGISKEIVSCAYIYGGIKIVCTPSVKH
jgi:hypothetical protein